MSQTVEAIHVPREIVNADSVYLVGWSVDDGAEVEAGAPVCEIETSKAIEVVEASRAGFVRQRVVVGDEVPVGGILGYITEAADTPLPETSAGAEMAAGTAAPADVQISAKARQKMEELGLDVSHFQGQGVIRERDVVETAERLKAAAASDPRGPFRLEPLGPIQRRVARVMEESVAAMPVSTLERIIDLASARERAKELAKETKAVITEVDLLVAAVGRACVEHPCFNGFLTPDYQLQLFEQVNVSVAVDVEGDLFVVTVADAANKTPEAIAKDLRGLQYLAVRRRLTSAHVGGGTITVTSMLGRGIHRFQPIPYPHQAAILGLSDCEPESTRATLTLVFDHRVANGSRAARFVQAIADRLHESRCAI